MSAVARRPLHAAAGVVEAPLETVAESAFALLPQPEDAHVHVDADPVRRVFALQGNWWYRGEYAFEPHERGTMVVHRVFNIARVGRWAVPLVLLQYRLSGTFTAETVRAELADALRRIGDRLRCPAYLLDDGRGGTSDAFGPLRGAAVALLTSYRRDGGGVGTPVSIAVRDGRAYFTTRSRTWKVKRIANNPRITLAPCTRLGKVPGPSVGGTARRLSDAEAATLRGGPRYRLWALVYRLFYRDVPVSYEVTP